MSEEGRQGRDVSREGRQGGDRVEVTILTQEESCQAKGSREEGTRKNEAACQR